MNQIKRLLLILGNSHGPVFLKRFFYRLYGINLKFVKIGAGVKLKGNVKFFAGVEIRDYCFIQEAEIGENTVIERNTSICGVNEHKLIIGNECYVGQNCVLDGSGGLVIGNFVHLSAGVAVWTHSALAKAIRSIPVKTAEGRKTLPVKIEDCVWIGGNSTISPGVSIGKKAMVSPGSFVEKDVLAKSRVEN